jgi:DNA mismatch endonuclease, patch repair protein
MSEYERDGRAPMPSSETTSRVMSANRGRDTGPELSLRKALWREGVRGYRVNMKGLPGSPDMVFTRQQLAIFVHGCFWHRCPMCQMNAPKTHVDFWSKKFERNEKRDIKALDDLHILGWHTLVVWECEIRDDLDGVVQRVKDALEE